MELYTIEMDTLRAPIPRPCRFDVATFETQFVSPTFAQMECKTSCKKYMFPKILAHRLISVLYLFGENYYLSVVDKDEFNRETESETYEDLERYWYKILDNCFKD